MRVPVYIGQPGTSDLGGALPPPQSKGSQISPSSGSYQWVIPSSQWPKVWVAHWKAAMGVTSKAAAERTEMDRIVGFDFS